jgi:serine/threonine-protein kinase ATR
MSVKQMFSPFWRSIAPTVVKDLQNRPQTAQLMADLLGTSVSDLLLMTQTCTLPWLVLTKNKDVILRIAQVRRDDDPWRTIIQDSANLGSIMALLLVQNVPNLEGFIMDLLRHISPHYAELDLVDLLKIDPIQIAIELLAKAGEEDDSKRSRVGLFIRSLAH